MKIIELNPSTNKISFGESRVNAMFFNDFHGSTENLDSLKTAYDEFKKEHKGETNIVLSGGDNFIDKSENNRIVNEAMNEILDASTVGNHDLEGQKSFFDTAAKSKFKWVAANLKYTKRAGDLFRTTPVKKSVVIDKNGERIGVIGIAPFDYNKIAFLKKNSEEAEVRGLKSTLTSVRKEAAKLEKNNINKIILLAHTGEKAKLQAKLKSDAEINYYDELAKIGGVDVIIGGHDHKQVDRWVKSERNEPVKIVSTGRTSTKKFRENLDTFGILNLAFDDKGVLIKSRTKNRFIRTENYPKSDFVSKFKDKADFETIYTLKEPLTCTRPLEQENKIGSLVCDACLWYVNQNTQGEKAVFCFSNAGTFRGDFDECEVSFNDIKRVVPFTSSTLIKTTLTKKQIIDTLNWCVESTKLPKISPGVMQVSGMKYTIGKDSKVKDVCIIDEKGRVKTRLDDVPEDREFCCVYDVFLATGVAGLKDLKKDMELEEQKGNMEYFTASRQSSLRDYLEAFKDKDIYDLTYTRIKQEK